MKKLAIIGAALIVIGIVMFLYGYGNVRICPAITGIDPGAACEQANQALGLLVFGGLVVVLVGCILVILGFVRSHHRP